MSYKLTYILNGLLKESSIDKKFQKAVEDFREETIKMQNLQDEQQKLVAKFKKAKASDKEKLKGDIISMHKRVKEQKKRTDQAEAKFNRALENEPTDLELD